MCNSKQLFYYKNINTNFWSKCIFHIIILYLLLLSSIQILCLKNLLKGKNFFVYFLLANCLIKKSKSVFSQQYFLETFSSKFGYNNAVQGGYIAGASVKTYFNLLISCLASEKHAEKTMTFQ